MILPDVLRNAPILWRPTLPPPPLAPSCSLTCYRPVSQCQTYWCWVAVLQELFRCFEHKVFSQCQLVETFLRMQCNCDSSAACNPTIQSLCNKTAVLEDILAHLWPSRLRPREGVLAKGPLCDALNNDRPVVGLFIEGNQNHYAVLSGLTTVNGLDYLEISEPKGGRLLDNILFRSDRDIEHPDGWTLNTAFFL
jgi:hypothetical protein